MGVCWLTNIFNKILTVNKMPSELRRSTLIHICKNKGDIQNCTVVVELNLWSHSMKH